MGQQLPQGKGQLLALFVEADDLQIRGKFLEHLAAYPTGDAEVVSASGYGDADKIGVPSLTALATAVRSAQMVGE